MGKENHVFAPAYKDADIKELGEICDHIIFNSFAQLRRHKDAVSGKSLGLRINPVFHSGDHAIYDPCAPGSRLGVTKEVFDCEIAAEPQLLMLWTVFISILSASRMQMIWQNTGSSGRKVRPMAF